MSLQPIHALPLALACFTRVVPCAAAAADPPNAAQIAANCAYADKLFAERDYFQAAKEYRIVHRIFAHVLGADHPETMAVHDKLADTFSIDSRPDEEIPERRAILDRRLRMLGQDHPDTLATMHKLAKKLMWEKEGEELFKRLLSIRRRISGAEAPITLQTWQELAQTMSQVDHEEAAETEFREILAIRRRILGSEHRDTLNTQFWLAASLRDQKRYAEADKEFSENLAILERIEDFHDPQDPDNNPKVLILMYLAGISYNEGRYEEQEARLRKMIALRKLLDSKGRRYPAVPLFQSYAYVHLAESLLLQKKYAEAEVDYRAVLLLYDEKCHGKTHGIDSDVFNVCNKLARSLKEQGKLQEALEFTLRVEGAADIKVKQYKALYDDAVKLRHEIEMAMERQ